MLNGQINMTMALSWHRCFHLYARPEPGTRQTNEDMLVSMFAAQIGSGFKVRLQALKKNGVTTHWIESSDPSAQVA
jgi:hypothetical protein